MSVGLEALNVESKQKTAPPVATKVGCLNHVSRWVGCCDVFDSDPNLREGVLKKRACTDVPWLLAMFLFSALCIGLIWVPAAEEGDWTRFTGPSDFVLNTCGVDENFEDLPYAAWINQADYEIKVCVKDCSATKDFVFPYTHDSTLHAFWCIPDQAGDAFMSAFEDNVVVQYMMDLYSYKEVPIYSAVFTIVFLFGFFIFVRLFFKYIMYAIFGGVLFATGFGAYSFMKDGREIDEAGYYTGVAILVGGISLWCLMMCCWSSLMQVVNVMQQAADALIKMPHLLLFPILSMPISLGIFTAWYLVCLLMFSAAEPEGDTFPGYTLPTGIYQDLYSGVNEPAQYHTYKYEVTEVGEEFFIHLFWMFWGLKFMEYFNFVIVSGCIADWYLDRELVDNPEENEEYARGNCARLCGSIYRTIRYHLGTIAFSSALIAALQTIECILIYVQKQIGDTNNPFAKMVLKIALAVVKCLECIMDRCNKCTLVVTAVLGSPFCAGCGKSLQLFFKNMSLMSLGTGMIMLMCLLANIVIALMSSGLCGYIFLGVENAEGLNSNLMPLLSGFLVSYFLGKLMLGVWDCAATTILVCDCMLKEWYKEEFGKHLGRKAKKAVKPKKGDVEMYGQDSEQAV